ncbi:transposase zinc-binding domain-containing protein, partial [Proteiniclasticum sp. C24MP]|uniref:IS91 family transposase n=1 Tax=Proteiniclasticum sp. C24MP TaxID=3374101 RepID=UPI00375503F4
MSYAIQNIFSQAYDQYRGSTSVRPAAHKAAVSITRCKTALLGGNSAVCQDCGAAEVHYNSCRNRHCPCCQAVNKEKWIDARKTDVVDAPYFHAVFTVPEQLNSLFLANRRLLFSLLYDSSAATLKELAGDKRHLGAQIGFISILHTWGSNLSFHPHIHAIVLGGGLSRDQEFIASKTGFLFPVRAVSKLFRGKFLHGLKSLYQSGQLSLPFSEAMLRYPSQFNDFLSVLYAKEWIPHLKETFKGAANVIEYL